MARGFWAAGAGRGDFAAPSLAALAPALPLRTGDGDDENAAFLVGDGPDAAKRKLKKSFCEPGTVSPNPPLELARRLVEDGLVAALSVSRAPENGGDAAYGPSDLGKLVDDFRSEALHPGDLKPAVVAALKDSVLAASAAGAAYPEAKADAACLKALAKRLAKAKK